MRLQELHVAKAGPGWDKHLQKNLRPLQLHGHQQPPVLSVQAPTSPPQRDLIPEVLPPALPLSPDPLLTRALETFSRACSRQRLWHCFRAGA